MTSVFSDSCTHAIVGTRTIFWYSFY
uniref:Uncharacterized protein n=1 Tax=Arundo donax TaxID=35708 RepID=A0A0A8ZVD8_ARUDO